MVVDVIAEVYVTERVTETAVRRTAGDNKRKPSPIPAADQNPTGEADKREKEQRQPTKEDKPQKA